MNRLLFTFYGIFLIWITFFSYLFVESNVFNIFLSDFASKNRSIVAVFFFITLCAFFLFYWLFLKKIVKKEIQAFNVKKLILVTCSILFFSYPAMLSYDIFNYVATAKITYFYKENPYVIMPIEMIGDSLLVFMHAPNKVALYGPVWILLSYIPYVLGFGNFVVVLFSFKLFSLLFYLGTSFMIWKLSKNIVSVAFFSLNPLVIIETLISGHNDIVMMFLVLCSFFLIKKEKKILSIILFFLSILIKYSTLFLIPVFLYILWNRKNNNINWQKIYVYCLALMLIIFFLSPIREEMYPWYAIWFLPFASLIPQNRLIVFMTLVFTFGLLLRYVPYMFLGTYSAPTPFLRIVFTLLPVCIGLFYVFIKQSVWLKNIFRF